MERVDGKEEKEGKDPGLVCFFKQRGFPSPADADARIQQRAVER